MDPFSECLSRILRDAGGERPHRDDPDSDQYRHDDCYRQRKCHGPRGPQSDPTRGLLEHDRLADNRQQQGRRGASERDRGLHLHYDRAFTRQHVLCAGYATNTAGKSYGNQVEFKTQVVLTMAISPGAGGTTTPAAGPLGAGNSSGEEGRPTPTLSPWRGWPLRRRGASWATSRKIKRVRHPTVFLRKSSREKSLCYPSSFFHADPG